MSQLTSLASNYNNTCIAGDSCKDRTHKSISAQRMLHLDVTTGAIYKTIYIITMTNNYDNVETFIALKKGFHLDFPDTPYCIHQQHKARR